MFRETGGACFERLLAQTQLYKELINVGFGYKEKVSSIRMEKSCKSVSYYRVLDFIFVNRCKLGQPIDCDWQACDKFGRDRKLNILFGGDLDPQFKDVF